MKKFIFGLNAIAIIITGIFTFAGCEKEKSTDIRPVTAEYKITEFSTDEVTFAKIENLAEKHNQYLDEILANYNLDNDDYQSEIINNIMNANLDNATIEQKEQICSTMMERGYTPTFEDMETAIGQCDALNNKTEILHFINALLSETLKCSSFEEISNEITSMQNAANEIFNDSDIIFCLSYSELLRKSMYYWLPEELGGNGFGYSILCYSTPPKPGSQNDAHKKVSVAGEAAIADCSALAISMTYVGISGLFNPVIGAGTLVGAAVESAASSAFTAAVTALKNHKNKK